MKTLIVTNKYNGKKLCNFILTSFPNLSQNTLYKALRQKDIKINGKRVNKDCIIFENDELNIFIADSLLFPQINLDIVYEDNNILVINKPINLEVVGENSLTTLVHQKYPKQKPMPCHRLDRNTTGLVLFAKNDTALNILFDKFKKHEIKKSYTALIQCKLETGRTHQIRAHLAHIGYPIIGDGKYGINQINKQFGYKYQQLNSFKLEFNFVTDAGILNYLNGTVITQKALHLI